MLKQIFINYKTLQEGINNYGDCFQQELNKIENLIIIWENPKIKLFEIKRYCKTHNINYVKIILSNKIFRNFKSTDEEYKWIVKTIYKHSYNECPLKQKIVYCDNKEIGISFLFPVIICNSDSLFCTLIDEGK